MRIRVTDSGSRNANQNLGRANLRNWNVGMLQSLSDVSELYRAHHQNSLLVTDHSSLACELAFVVRGVEMTF
jgi:hypothetical protein